MESGYYVRSEDINQLTDTLKDIVMNDWFGNTKDIDGCEYVQISGKDESQKRSRIYVLRHIKDIDIVRFTKIDYYKGG